VAQWLFAVCRNRALDVCRKEKRMKAITDQQAASQISREEQQERLLERHDSFERVQLVLATLSENQQEVVRLKFQDGLSYRDIADVTGLSVSNVGYLLHTAVRRLRERLAVSD